MGRVLNNTSELVETVDARKMALTSWETKPVTVGNTGIPCLLLAFRRGTGSLLGDADKADRSAGALPITRAMDVALSPYVVSTTSNNFHASKTYRSSSLLSQVRVEAFPKMGCQFDQPAVIIDVEGVLVHKPDRTKLRRNLYQPFPYISVKLSNQGQGVMIEVWG
jgi:hypothetical protein